MVHVIKPLKIACVASFATLLAAGLISASDSSGISALLAITPFLVLLLIASGVVAAGSLLTAIGRYILGPLDRAARHRNRPTQFTMVDFLSLMFLFQLPMAALRGWANLRDEPAIWVFYGFGWLATAAMWASSVRTLSRAGIENTWHRGVFLAFVLPAAYFGSIVFTFSLFAAVIFLFFEQAATRSGVFAFIAADAGLLAAFFLSAKFVRKMTAASGAEAEPGLSDSDAEPPRLHAAEMPGADVDVDHP